METTSKTFGVKYNNIPVVNLRNEFRIHLGLFRDPLFLKQFRLGGQPIETPYVIWLGTPSAMLTLLLQRAVSGIEAWVIHAVWEHLAPVGKLHENSKFLRNPGSLPGAGMAAKIYCRLPALASAEYAMSRNDPELWERTQAFYREVRNPLMHGHEIDSDCVDQVAVAYEHIYQLHKWADKWSDPDSWWRNDKK
jgi:hypothetical protein